MIDLITNIIDTSIDLFCEFIEGLFELITVDCSDDPIDEEDEILYVTIDNSTYIIRQDDIKTIGELKDEKCNYH